MERDALATNPGATSDMTLRPTKPIMTRRRRLASVLAPAIALGLLAAIAVGPSSASPAMAAPPETGALRGFHLIREPPRPGADAHPTAVAHGFHIVAEPPRPSGPQHETTAGMMRGFNIFPDPPRPGPDLRSATMARGFSIIYQPPRPTG